MNMIYLIAAGILSSTALGTALYTVYTQGASPRAVPSQVAKASPRTETAEQRLEKAKKKRSALLSRGS